MLTAAIVEPSALLRLGIQQVVQKLACDVRIEALDYIQLFSSPSKKKPTSLMLLSAPKSYDQLLDLLQAADRSREPQRILLLADTPELPFSLMKLPAKVQGYVYKHSCPDVLHASIMLVLAGGSCFPQPGKHRPDTGKNEIGDQEHPKRRWYDFSKTPLTENATSPQANLLPQGFGATKDQASAPTPGADNRTHTRPCRELIEAEAGLLHLTPRQYEVLVLLAMGYPLKKISRELKISLATAKTHTEAIYQRLAVNSRNAAVFAALSHGATLGWSDHEALGSKVPSE